MASFYRASVQEFLSHDEEQILARLSLAYANRGYTSQYSDQTLTWSRDLASLRHCLQQCVLRSDFAKHWGLLLEFSIPRKESRIDIVVLIRDVVVILEAKTGSLAERAKRQVEEYALLLHYFHKPSSEHKILPVVVSAIPFAESRLARPRQLTRSPQLPTSWIAQVVSSSWQDLTQTLLSMEDGSKVQLCAPSWDEGVYFPVPSIFEAATALRSGLAIREIAHSEASEHEIDMVRQTLQSYVDRARAGKHHAICFLTGVPGSGKTLVGLSLAHSSENKADSLHFMSGNGPLVKVLQHLFTQQSRKGGATAEQARTEAKTLIENVHVFARYYTDENRDAPSNHAIVFDEAQRAWNQAQNFKKFKRPYSEPEMLLRVMERHEDWAVVIALVGGGQEINDGEAGLEEWGRALISSSKSWVVHASPEVLNGGASTANHQLFSDRIHQKRVRTDSALHLRTSNRSLRAEKLAEWVNLLLDGDADGAAHLKISDRFPVFVTRDLEEARAKLREQGIGENRYGLVGSSGAARLRAEGLEPSSTFHSEYPWEHWYLAGESDVRSSYRCEVFATEFEIQGLELDWIGLCWGGDLIWDALKGWQHRALRHGQQSQWMPIKNREKQVFRKNAYRVLLTRARKGMVIFVPKGDAQDKTMSPVEFNTTAEFLERSGATPLSFAGAQQLSCRLDFENLRVSCLCETRMRFSNWLSNG